MQSYYFTADFAVRSSYPDSSLNPHEPIMPTIYPQSQLYQEDLLRVIAQYDHTLPYPLSLHINATNCYGILYSIAGEGTISTSVTSYQIPPSCVFFFSCNGTHRMESNTSSWRFTCLYVIGETLTSYYSLFLNANNQSQIHTVSKYSMIPSRLQELSKLKRETNLISLLEENKLIHIFYLDLVIELNQKHFSSEGIPKYILILKQEFDYNYIKDYDLDTMSKLLNISKYRLCHEFTKIIGISPLKYLNQHRIHIACDILTKTNHPIYEVGNMVGISNTNHFINLFKRYSGVTPSVYRNRCHSSY